MWWGLYPVGRWERRAGGGKPQNSPMTVLPGAGGAALSASLNSQLMQRQSCWGCIRRFPWQPRVASPCQCQDCSTLLLHRQPGTLLLSASSQGLWWLRHLLLHPRFVLQSKACCELFFSNDSISLNYALCCLFGRNHLCRLPFDFFWGNLALFPSPLSPFTPPHHSAFSFCCV